MSCAWNRVAPCQKDMQGQLKALAEPAGSGEADWPCSAEHSGGDGSIAEDRGHILLL
jgi:hypothetical protein